MDVSDGTVIAFKFGLRVSVRINYSRVALKAQRERDGKKAAKTGRILYLTP